MILFKCEINDLNWSKNWMATNIADPGATLSTTDIKVIYVLVVTISTQNNAKLLEQLKSGFKRTINWHIY